MNTSHQNEERLVGSWILLFPATYLIHIGEEYGGGFPAWTATRTGLAISDIAFLVANGLLWLLMLGAVLTPMHRRLKELLVVSLATIVIVNATLHVGGTLITRSYSPGLASGVLLWLPLGIHALGRGWRALSSRDFGFGVTLGVVMHLLAPLVWIGATVAISMVALVSPAFAQPADPASALYREVPFQDLGRPPVGAPVASGPVIGLREDQVRARARATGKSRESTKQDTRLRDAWALSKRFTKPGEKLRWLEFEFTDGKRNAWLPVAPLIVPALLGAKAGDEFELLVHRFDAPHAGAELAGSESVVMNAMRVAATSVAATRAPVLHDGGLSFDYRGSRLGIGLRPGGATAVTMGSHPEQASAFVLDLANPDRSLARIEVAGLNGPGTYAPRSLVIELPAGSGGPNPVDVAGCRVKVATANPWEIAGTLECPAGERRPTRAEFRIQAR